MFKQIICITVAAGLAGCATTTQESANLTKTVSVTVLESSLAQQQTDLMQAMDESKKSQSLAITSLSKQITALEQKLAPEKQIVPVVPDCPASPLGGKFILGSVEKVFVEEVKANFNTRIDTGAESSSLDARNIILFERDGKQWVRYDVFTLGEKAPAQTFESKVERFIRIKQDADSQADRRPVIHAHLQIGKYTAETDLNLVDRSHLDFPLLLGRKFMQDIAVVDVGQTYIHGKKKPAPAPVSDK
ncbi:ATP-dependent zinc protease [Shewanella sp. VB17]|uniref:ATP-dependent zinc protease family protein n=1 Tax=Shewanella sp. VB17 TaxID=2739432 RepID=UPI001563BAD4|nr:RimK/LysX family protein [Shewanella sp. VB17]NRD73933.1 ATP-dependent zinc protease [Shewanella sp. VB17]